MKLIKPNLEILEQQPGLDGIYKQIELAGRTCYKSEDKITEDSAKAFVDRMIKSGHGAMLEHGTVYLMLTNVTRGNLTEKEYNSKLNKLVETIIKYEKNPYSRIKHDIANGMHYITTNYRVLVENDWLDDLQYICEPTEYHEKRITVKWTLDRVTGESFLRHRVFSFARESTRYCNYSKDKFGNEITFMIPTYLDEEKLKQYGPYHLVTRDNTPESIFIAAMNTSEKDYFKLLELGWKPQQARQVLPFSVHSPLVMTGFESDWKHFFSLRSPKAGATGVHPDAAYLADKLYDKLNNN